MGGVERMSWWWQTEENRRREEEAKLSSSRCSARHTPTKQPERPTLSFLGERPPSRQTRDPCYGIKAPLDTDTLGTYYLRYTCE